VGVSKDFPQALADVFRLLDHLLDLDRDLLSVASIFSTSATSEITSRV
jgi:hypothetical protein